jgi:hypothetical protein
VFQGLGGRFRTFEASGGSLFFDVLDAQILSWIHEVNVALAGPQSLNIEPLSRIRPGIR